jgi:hypothetical protein
MADFNAPGGGSGANLGEIEARLAAIKRSVSQLESRLQRDVAAESKGAAPGRRATERAVRDDLTPESQRAKVQETKATESDTAAVERNTRARRTRLNTLQEEINRTRRATRLQEPVPPSVAAQRSTLLPQAGTAERDAAAIRKQAEAKGLLASIDARQATEQRATTSLLSADIQKRELASQALRKHGALTTEFISAAARGNVTLREMSFQVGATIGKFAGWTAAAGATYGALAAVTQLGKGALDSASSVQILDNYIQGLDTDKAREQLRQLAQEFNLPVDQVGEAFQGMGKIFHDQDQAFAATKAALYGVKVGELSAADSTKYLTAVVNGFHLSGDRLVDGARQGEPGAEHVTASGDQGHARGRGPGGGRVEGRRRRVAAANRADRDRREGHRPLGREHRHGAPALGRNHPRSSKSQEALRGYGIDPDAGHRRRSTPRRSRRFSRARSRART